LSNNIYCPSRLSTDAGQTNVWAVLDEIAEKVPAGSNRVIFTPWLYGEKFEVES